MAMPPCGYATVKVRLRAKARVLAFVLRTLCPQPCPSPDVEKRFTRFLLGKTCFGAGTLIRRVDGHDRAGIKTLKRLEVRVGQF